MFSEDVNENNSIINNDNDANLEADPMNNDEKVTESGAGLTVMKDNIKKVAEIDELIKTKVDDESQS